MDENSALAILATAFRTRTRPVDLVTVRQAIRVAESSLGSRTEVARRAGVSAGMLNRFIAVDGLSPPVLQLVRVRKIDKVSDVHQLSRVRQIGAQNVLAEWVSAGKLHSRELRDIVTILLRNPGSNPDKVARRVRGSRRQVTRVYAIVMPVSPQLALPGWGERLRERLAAVGVRPEKISQGPVGPIVVLSPGALRLARRAAAAIPADVTDLAERLLREAPA